MNKKTLISLLVVAIILIAATVWVINLNPQSKDITPDDKAETYTVSDISDKSLTEISVTLPDTSYTFKKGASDMYTYVESPSADLNQAMINQLENFLKNVVAEEKATDDAFSLSDYGFDKPKSEVKITYDGGEMIYKVGNLTQGNGYFLNMDGSKEVYVIHSAKALALMQPVSYFRNPALHSVDSQTLTIVEFDGPDGRIALKKEASSTGEELWNMTSPIKKSADMTNIDSYISQYIPLITVKEFTEDNVSDLSKYGLGNDARLLYFEDASGNFGHIYLGNTHSSGMYTYARKDGSNNVVSIETKNIEFVDMNMFTFVDSLVNLEVLADVEKIEFKKGDTVRTMDIKRQGDSRKESEINSEYYINDVRVSANSFKKIYTDIIALDIERLADNITTGNPVYEITYFKGDGSKVNIQFIKHTERHYGAMIDGECKYIVLKEKLDNIYAQLSSIK
ncbi:MAG: DUF4340 domain-containing protein [Ruminococcaceae bacterium]|nr:DUF4340 domain-containing protein [Oscillospiraceae bacterium]